MMSYIVSINTKDILDRVFGIDEGTIMLGLC
jgi:hypothetical protein